MEEQTFARWVELPDGQPVRFDDLPALIAGALHQDDFARAAAEINLEAELRAMVDARELDVRNALTLGPHTFPHGQALRDSVLLPEDLRPLLAKRGMGLRFKAAITHPPPGELIEGRPQGGAGFRAGNARQIEPAPQPWPAADWDLWAYMPRATLREAVLLSVGLEPRLTRTTRAGYAPPEWPEPGPEFRRRLALACAHVAAEGPLRAAMPMQLLGEREAVEVNLSEFRAWAEGLRWPMPELFPAAGKPLPDAKRATAAPAAAPPPSAKKWTPARLEELRAYRKAHGTKAAAEWAGISASRVRDLLPGDKPTPKGYSAFTHRPR